MLRPRRQQSKAIRLVASGPDPKQGALRTIGWLDQRLLVAMRTRGHTPGSERLAKALGRFGELGSGWLAVGVALAAIDPARRRSWFTAGLAGPAGTSINYVVKVLIGRQRPLIEEHPMLARAPSKLSFPSAHSTSGVAAAAAIGRTDRRLALPFGALAATICASRPFLGMHYPSDVAAGIALGLVLGRAWPVESRDEEVWAS